MLPNWNIDSELSVCVFAVERANCECTQHGVCFS